MPRVTIIGAGVAGLTAAFRLAERGYDVNLFEQDGFVGGKFRATRWVGNSESAFHEHSYHMFLNWYHNFWQIAEEIGARKMFVPLTSVHFLRSGHFPKLQELVNFGSLASVPQNLLSGVLPISEMMLYMYSVLDLLGTPMGQSKYHDLISVNAFASTRPYATEASVKMYDEYLAKTFAIASYQSSAKTFQSFLEYGTYCPEPLYWALAGDCYSTFLRPMQDAVQRRGVNIYFYKKAAKLHLGRAGKVAAITFEQVREGFHPTLSEFPHQDALQRELLFKEKDKYEVDGSVILAVPHSAVSKLLTPDLLNRNPELGESEKLRSVPMASVHLHLNKKFRERLGVLNVRLPREPIVLVDSRYKLSFVANSSLWPELRDTTYLNIVASDSRPLEHLEAPAQYTDDRRHRGPGHDLNLEDPVTTLDHILHEFRRFVHFERDEIDFELLHLDRNTGRELFINEVGSWMWRPETRTAVSNLFLAGDFCKNPIDVVCLEGAVVSGLQAAECVRRREGRGAPIMIALPKRYPYPTFWPLKVALAPYVAAAKAWAVFKDVVKALGE